ncbi:ABC transporter ATP-binding protein [Alkalihalophilus lindianensis]|uniref:ABC transporter ATP-binding protein n=1 Tax=Alkalihalophilus lindianensis TaxID=1630542 RepID=A0ABU3X4F7_9BACI|nr:ABC transporter ATP-binding protein [Alkalihalophilus lindianensis]MDV2682775.1 ABC transporter ATP-binding protein [Alkalihalophilus lindianensis]
MEDAVTLINVNKAYKGFALKDISFSVKKGFITGFIGPNGAGKTTTIKLMLQLLQSDSGKIELFGNNDATHMEETKQRIGFVYSDHLLYEHLTVEKMKRVIGTFYPKWDDEVFAYYMKRLNLPWKRKIGDLSKGMGMKLSIAIALSHHAELIVLDEPTSGLDPISRREILDLLAEVIQDEEKAVFFSTHITSDLEQIADYITFINNGEIVFHENKETIMEQHTIVRGAKELLDDDIRTLFLQVRETSVGFEGLTNQAELVRRLMGEHVVMEQASLEDIMVYTVGKV